VGGVNITVEDSFIHNGDDCVPVNAGAFNVTNNVTVRNVHCECGTNGGVLVGISGLTANVLFTNMTVLGTNQGAGMKVRVCVGFMVKFPGVGFTRSRLLSAWECLLWLLGVAASHCFVRELHS
jgi:polygalacturonase